MCRQERQEMALAVRLVVEVTGLLSQYTTEPSHPHTGMRRSVRNPPAWSGAMVKRAGSGWGCIITSEVTQPISGRTMV